eukprot:Skav228682  [mRNA]  locus=scaffold111:84717:85202:- [translate_table: standard]
MARQHVGSRRFNIVVVGMVNVVLCLDLPITGSRQALAVPGSRKEATRATLQKLTMKELKPILPEKGLKVSGNKQKLVERLMEASPKMRKIPALKLAVPDTNVFIALDETIQKLEAFLQQEGFVFMLVWLAASLPWAQYLRRQPSKYLQVFAPENGTFQNWQ